MVGARFVEVVLRRPDLRTAFPRRFTARLPGSDRGAAGSARQVSAGARCSSAETLLMHLGMSGSFRVEAIAGCQRGRHDHVVFRMSSGASVTFSHPRRFGFMDLFVRRASWPGTRRSADWVLNRCRRDSTRPPWRGPAAARKRRSRRRCSMNGSSPGSATSTRAKRLSRPASRRSVRCRNDFATPVGRATRRGRAPRRRDQNSARGSGGATVEA